MNVGSLKVLIKKHNPNIIFVNEIFLILKNIVVITFLMMNRFIWEKFYPNQNDFLQTPVDICFNRNIETQLLFLPQYNLSLVNLYNAAQMT